MSKLLSKQDKKSSTKVSKWDNAIADAQKTIRRLELAIETYRQNKAANEPWPGDTSTQN